MKLKSNHSTQSLTLKKLKQELNEQADKVENFEDTVIIVKEYEDIIRTKKKKTSMHCLSSRECVQKIYKEGEVPQAGQRVQGSLCNDDDDLQDKHSKADQRAFQINKVISNIEFFKDLFCGHSRNV